MKIKNKVIRIVVTTIKLRKKFLVDPQQVYLLLCLVYNINVISCLAFNLVVKILIINLKYMIY